MAFAERLKAFPYRVYERRVVLLENTECSGEATCYNGRTFSFDRVEYVSRLKMPLLLKA